MHDHSNDGSIDTWNPEVLGKIRFHLLDITNLQLTSFPPYQEAAYRITREYHILAQASCWCDLSYEQETHAIHSGVNHGTFLHIAHEEVRGNKPLNQSLVGFPIQY